MEADVCKNLNSNAEVHVTMTAPLVVTLRLLTSTFFGFLWLEIACEVWGWRLLQVQEGVDQKSLIKVLCWHLLTSVSPLLWGCVSLPAFNCKAGWILVICALLAKNKILLSCQTLWSVDWLSSYCLLVCLSAQSIFHSLLQPWNFRSLTLFCLSSTQCFSWGALNLSTYINQESRSGYQLLGFPKGWRDGGMASFPRALIAHTL